MANSALHVLRLVLGGGRSQRSFFTSAVAPQRIRGAASTRASQQTKPISLSPSTPPTTPTPSATTFDFLEGAEKRVVPPSVPAPPPSVPPPSSKPSPTTRPPPPPRPPPAIDFLEGSEDEYAAASDLLPEREAKPVADIPWPTMFAHGRKPSLHVQQPCELVARLVADQKFNQARTVAEQLAQLHTPVVNRQIYLNAALKSLDTTPKGRANFLFWLKLYPNRPATRNTPELRNVWEPIANRLAAEHIGDPDFLGEFLILAGRKGLLNAVAAILIQPLTFALPPQRSEAIIRDTMDAFVDACSPKESQSARAKRLRELVEQQVQSVWNKYARALAVAGYKKPAVALLKAPPAGVRFVAFTRSMVYGGDATPALPIEERRRLAEDKRRSEAEAEAQLAAFLRDPPENLREVAWRMDRCLYGTFLSLPYVSVLADIQHQLLRHGRREELKSFEKLFLSARGDEQTHDPTNTRWQWYRHAEILRHSRNGNHAKALAIFRRHFIWVGLPPTTVGENPAPSDIKRRLPTNRVISTVLRSILTLMSPTERTAYLLAYYDSTRSVCPTLQPTEYTHLVFVGVAGLLGGPQAAFQVMTVMTQRGFDPGRPALTALMLHFIAARQTEEAFDILTRMERRRSFPRETLTDSTVKACRPDMRTYVSMLRLCLKKHQPKHASEVLLRLQKYVVRKHKAVPKSERSDENTARVLSATETLLAHLSEGDGDSKSQASPDDIRRAQAEVEVALDQLTNQGRESIQYDEKYARRDNRRRQTEEAARNSVDKIRRVGSLATPRRRSAGARDEVEHELDRLANEDIQGR